MVSHFYLIPERLGRTDGRTDGQNCYINIARQYADARKKLLNALEQNASKTLISLARLCHVKYGRFWLLSGRREIGAEIRELPENTGDLATLVSRRHM